MPGARTERARPEAVDEHDEGPIDRWKPEPIRSAEHRVEAVRQNIGKARPRGIRGR
ncbi:hypothetical protein GCM10022239_22180 [Leifsonia bigeumensis]|uniref:Uncharacterized protein n=1 Tax=Leifsonella bigeumensis TaxID=433643 RepID=A0ABP7FR30_9MICO